jgi:hypothetical protein
MLKEAETINIDVGFENMMKTIYGYKCHGLAGRVTLTAWKRHLQQLFGTIRTAIEKNINGDDRHREIMIGRCDTAIDSVRRANSKDEICCSALTFAFELCFEILGELPNNWQTRKAHYHHITELSKYRTLNYIRTDSQKAGYILDLAYRDQLNKKDPQFDVLIKKFTGDCAKNPRRFLSWLRSEHKSLYDRYL